jgi:hypothetical protein
MFRILSAISALGFMVLVSCGSQPPGEPAEQRLPIMGGQPDAREEHQAIAYLMFEDLVGRAYCTGTLITRRVVLTAAHCCEVIKPVTAVGVGFGDRIETVSWVPISGYVIHPLFGEIDRNDNDICLILLGRNPPPEVVPIPYLPSDLGVTPGDIGDDLEFVGYGLDENDISGVRRSMRNQIDYLCTEKLGCILGPEQFYGSYATLCHDQDPGAQCPGDSGGPALIVRDGQEYVAGVASYMAGMCPDSVFACSAKVDEYQEFIDRYVQQGQGMLCSCDEECGDLSCVDGVCCESTCEDPCMVCNLPGQVGVCVVAPDGTYCDDDDPCNGREACYGGTCQPGVPLECDDFNICTEDYCDPVSICRHRPINEGAACGEKGEAGATCQLGKCVEPAKDDGCGTSGSGLITVLPLVVLLVRRLLVSADGRVKA